MRKRLLVLSSVIIIDIAAAFILPGEYRYAAIVIGVIAFFMILILGDPPEKHKEFTDSDRLEATFRAQGGSPPAKLPLPDMPPIMSHKGNRVKRRRKK